LEQNVEERDSPIECPNCSKATYVIEKSFPLNGGNIFDIGKCRSCAYTPSVEEYYASAEKSFERDLISTFTSMDVFSDLHACMILIEQSGDEQYLFKVKYLEALAAKMLKQYIYALEFSEQLLNKYVGQLPVLNKEDKNKLILTLHNYVHLKAISENQSNRRSMADADKRELEIWDQVLAKYNLTLDSLNCYTEPLAQFKYEFLLNRITVLRDQTPKSIDEYWNWLKSYENEFVSHLISSSFDTEAVGQLDPPVCDEFVWIYYETYLWLARIKLVSTNKKLITNKIYDFVELLKKHSIIRTGSASRCNFADLLLRASYFYEFCFNGKSYIPNLFYWSSYTISDDGKQEYDEIMKAFERSDYSRNCSVLFILGELYFMQGEYAKAMQYHLESLRYVDPSIGIPGMSSNEILQKYKKLLINQDLQYLTEDIIKAESLYNKYLETADDKNGLSRLLRYHKLRHDRLNYAKNFLALTIKSDDNASKIRRIDKFYTVFQDLYEELIHRRVPLFLVPEVNINATGYIFVYQLEIALRNIVENTISKSGKNMAYFLGQDTLDKCKSRMHDDTLKNTFLDGRPGKMIDYLSFRELTAALSNVSKTYFEREFGDREIFFGKMKEVESIRNRIMHFRPLNKQQVKRLQDVLSIVQKMHKPA